MIPPRSAFLRVHGQDVRAWCKRYGVEPFSYPCNDCGRRRTTTVHFAAGQFRGLIAPPCECGTERLAPYAIVRDPKHGDLFSNWSTGEYV